MPRIVSQASIGPETAPAPNWRNPTASASSPSFTITAPPSTSLCPPRYFVVECTTTSAPRISGRCR